MNRRYPFLALTFVLALTSACTALVRLGAGPPHARARQSNLALDGAGQPAGIALEVDLYNPNPIDLAAARFDYRVEAGGAAFEGSVAAQGQLRQQQWQPIQLYVPVAPGSPVYAAIVAGEPYVITGSLVLTGGMSGLAVGVSGEGMMAPAQPLRVAVEHRGGGQ